MVSIEGEEGVSICQISFRKKLEANMKILTALKAMSKYLTNI
jgi:hypothetical protein